MDVVAGGPEAAVTREQESRALITVWGLGFAALLVLCAMLAGGW